MARNFQFAATFQLPRSFQRPISAPPVDDIVPAPMLIDGEEPSTDHLMTRRESGGEATSSPSSSSAKASSEPSQGTGKRELPNLDALSCSICMEPWTSQGDHQVCCLPCGHVYGLSCITIWIQQRGRNSKCPQCNGSCMLKDVRKIYASPVVVVDDNLQQKVESLESEIGSLKAERANLLGLQDNLLNLQDKLLKDLHQLKETVNQPLGSATAGEAQRIKHGHHYSPNLNKERLRCNFILEHELQIEGARLFDMDVSYQHLLLARRISGLGGTYMLNKINLINPHENEDIQLPVSIKAVKDLQVSPCGRLALLASLGKKLSIFSMGINKVTMSYDLPGPAWSCSWDVNHSHFLYAGLQNGMLLVFDMRRAINPLLSMVGLTRRPIHTIHSLAYVPAIHCSAKKLLTASSVGPCLWNATSAEERPYMVPGLENQDTCISLAYGPSSDDIVASYRPRVQASNERISCLSSSFNSPAVVGQGRMCSQVLVKRVAGIFYRNLGSAPAQLIDAQITKSAIINVDNCSPLFAYGDQVTNGLTLRELPSLSVSQNLKPHQHPILDVKYAHSQGPGNGMLGCISENKLQIFSAKIF